MTWAVIVQEDIETEVYLFPTVEKANQFVKDEYNECMAEERKIQKVYGDDEGCVLFTDECHCDVDNGYGYAYMAWSTMWTGAYPDERYTKVWEVVEATEMKEEK